MKEDIRRRRQERIRDILIAEEVKRKSHAVEDVDGISSPPAFVHPEVVLSYPSATVDNKNIEQREDYESSRRSQYDPEQQWKLNRTQWNERYGWEEPPSRGGSVWRSWRSRLLVSILLFAAAYGITSFPAEWNAPMRAWIQSSLHDEMDMRPIAAWYERTFAGTPVFIPLFPQDKESTKTVQAAHSYPPPIKGQIVQPFAMNLRSVAIEPDDSNGTAIEVQNIATGKIEQVTTDEKNGITVVVQHADGLVSVYGGLSSSSVQVDDWLESGATIGTIQGNGKSAGIGTNPVLTFAMQQRGVYIDPADVIRLD
ncbi:MULTISPECIES: M23 family metallopeptidase [Paenibacillus]|uniref:M23 family metallopeptidase n=1 Tax=Paenibacillus TaxID=44249 RepID=UPI0018CFCB2E|nr:M23 family metallopeptidase [Paenibacillus alvei]MBG9734508.1 hypothetical protein [Paenibacillus alvei]MBG9743181.1 hypothetical protein [Paenibacillus alvei]MCY9579500.1 M23 family metallopeptidase [Paenibacillus alvei]MCY9586459.1 M23 family metallopeptidase [Paenibacillus alvei]